MRFRAGFLAILLAFCLVQPAAAEEKYIALTFDDGPAGKITNRLLDGLEARQVPATFFLCCYRVTQYPELVKRMAAQGHEMGIHGCSHKYFTQMSEKELENELLSTQAAIRDLTGITPILMRPPGGLYNKTVENTAKNQDLSVVLWSIDPEDWDRQKRSSTANHVLSRAKDGDIVLLHDLSRENVDAALQIIDGLKAKGFHFCTVSSLAQRREIPLSPGSIHTAFRQKRKTDPISR